MSEAPQPITVSTLRGALAFFLEDDGTIDRLEADGLAELIQRDGVVDEEEKAFLREALTKCDFGDRALEIIKRLLDAK